MEARGWEITTMSCTCSLWFFVQYMVAVVGKHRLLFFIQLFVCSKCAIVCVCEEPCKYNTVGD